ncbi:ribosome maturation factor RimM [Ruania zhangjianzhongii]|uniref:ribosome maturation factor RimM n=1 Tax=Ruania zhangjianzhongii TaxID=2603206 RepID=UPI0011C86438|nr:ribosome maturation factor RimM [Ruania zhangjianzhongii]
MTGPSGDDELYLRLATIGAARGLAGQVRLRLHTDDPESRLAPGAVLTTEPVSSGPLEVTGLRRIQQHWYASFAGVTDRTGAEGLRGVVLLAPPEIGEPEAWYPHELAGLRAERADGAVLGTIDGVEHLPAQDALVLREVGGGRTLVPFVTEIVPVVDVPGGRVVLAPPPGLLAQDEEPGDGDDQSGGQS